MDPIVNNELAPSTGIYFFSLVFFSILFTTGTVEMPGYAPFLLSLFTTAVIFLILVWFRRNHIAVKIPTNFDHKNKLEELSFILIIFILYLSISALYPITRILWPVILVLIVIVLLRISFRTEKGYSVTLTNWLFFYMLVSALVVIHDLVLGNEIMQNLIFIAVLGIISVVVVTGYNKVLGDKEKADGIRADHDNE